MMYLNQKEIINSIEEYGFKFFHSDGYNCYRFSHEMMKDFKDQSALSFLYCDFTKEMRFVLGPKVIEIIYDETISISDNIDIGMKKLYECSPLAKHLLLSKPFTEEALNPVYKELLIDTLNTHTDFSLSRLQVK
jgi:hypothetical protein